MRIDRFLDHASGPGADPELDLAMLRAYSIERSVDYGCALEDVLKLRRRVEQGASWVAVAQLLGLDNLDRAGQARAAGLAATAAAFYLYASGCFRLAQAALEDRPAERLAAYRQNVAAFSAAMDQLGHCDARVAVSFRGAQHGAWLFRPAAAAAPPPCVLVWGGADGWCEAFFGSVPAFLERGLAVCLLELPGQGLARLEHGAFLDAAFTGMVGAAIDALSARGVARDRFGVAGNSFGGSLALRASAADARIKACCTNGGSVDMEQGFTRFPRVLRRVGRMAGDNCSDAQVLAMLAQLDVRASAAALATPVLCLHGGQDVLVTDAEAHGLVSLRGSLPSTLARWPEGVHCLNNHSVERDGVMADWFARQLLQQTIT
jgi:dienelactone hydrolase